MLSHADSGQVIGRDSELVAVEAFLSGSAGSAVLALEGEAGIGKTTIWLDGLRRARERDAVVLVTRPAKTEASLSFVGLVDLFSRVPAQVQARLPEPQRVALAGALLQAPVPARGIDEAALCAAVLSVLRLLASGPAQVVVAVDDAQWLDSPTERTLAFAARRLDMERVQFLVAVRVAGTSLPSFDQAVDPPRRRTLRLGPLSLPRLGELIQHRTGLSPSRPTLVQVAQLSGGNPFFALEIASQLGSRGTRGDRLSVPPNVTRPIEERLERLPRATRQALLVAAALAEPTVELVDRQALAAAEDGGIVTVDRGRVRFTHPLLASAVYGLAAPSQLRRLHRDLAGRVSSPEERARHLALSTQGCDEEIARELTAAATFVASRGAPAAAAGLVELAQGLTPMLAVQARSERLVAAARYWSDSGDLSRAQSSLEEALGGMPPGPARARALQLLSQLHGRRSSFTEAIRLALDALQEAGDDQALRAAVGLDLAYCSASMGDFGGAQLHAKDAARAAESCGDTEVLANVLGVMTICQFLGGGGLDRQRMDRALALEDLTRPGTFVVRPSYLHGNLLLWMGQPAEALVVHETLRVRLLERGEESALPMLTLYMVWSCLWLGDLERAARLADEARDAAVLLGDAAAKGIAQAALALVSAYQGRATPARAAAGEALSIFRRLDWQLGMIWALWALGLTELSSGRPEAVDAALGSFAEGIARSGGDVIVGLFLPDEIEALVELGQFARAEALTCWLEDGGKRFDRPWALAVASRCRGLLHAAAGRHPDALKALGEALAQHDRIELPFERARSMLVLGRVLRRAGKRTQAKYWLSAALRSFDQLGTPLWSARARSELARLGTRVSSPDMLTPTEARVAELAARGLSNRQVAELAFLSVKTVEANLTRIYRKLGLSSRAQLAHQLYRTASQPLRKDSSVSHDAHP
jgi:DNA-binding CsgD family transcriptional regulator